MTWALLTIGDLERWQFFGAEWRVVHLSDQRAIVDFRRCTGEPVERRESSDSVVVNWIRSSRAPVPGD
jgi:hypothetical protein